MTDEGRPEAQQSLRLAWVGVAAGLVGALIGSGGTLLGSMMTNSAASEQAHHSFVMEQRMAAYTELISAIDVDNSAMNAVLVDIYWRLGPKQIDDSGYHGAHTDAWDASRTALSHAVTRVLMVGSPEEIALATRAYELSYSARDEYIRETTDTGIERLKTHVNDSIAKNRHAFAQQAILEIQG